MEFGNLAIWIRALIRLQWIINGGSVSLFDREASGEKMYFSTDRTVQRGCCCCAVGNLLFWRCGQRSGSYSHHLGVSIRF